MKNFIIFSSLSLLLLTLLSCQTTNNSATPDRFAQADTNKDGKLDRKEAADYFVTSLFEARDLNHDGKLTWEEWHVPGGAESKARFDAADTNKDGSLSLEEARAYGRTRGVFADSFRKADTNHDGFVTREEAQAFYGSTEGPPR